MDVNKLFEDSSLDGIADNVFNVVNGSVSEVKAMQRKKVAENVQLVVDALKKIEADLQHDKLELKLKGKIVACLFFEPSTRTRLSFETAVLRLGGQVIGMENGSFTERRAHSKYIRYVPDLQLEAARSNTIDIDVEAKMKNYAVLKMRKDYGISF